ncbi:alpha/beta fold hydrolase [Sphingosinicella terrae]|uniref:alpha/beta fold hydrolase n=1 Tax=Sphingosinicella terrae TaxID=2172047 RepID=UPI000E0D4410|nr:alpha/beta hydrolase [Sphingosinicella terrae]
MDPLVRNNVKVAGGGQQAIIFAHGFGCDQHMWRYVAPAFEPTHRVVLFDHVGNGGSHLGAWDADKYGSLEGYAQDVLEICRALEIRDAVFVGHSVSAMIGLIAAKRDPGALSRLVLVGPSPCYIDDGDYVGGFARGDIEELLQFMDSNYLGWSSMLAPQIMRNVDRPELAEELTNSFCRTDPEIAKHFARVTFLSDNRDDLEDVRTPCLILQCSDDVIAPEPVGRYVQSRLPGSELVLMKATGHCPNLSAPEETIAAIRQWL